MQFLLIGFLLIILLVGLIAVVISMLNSYSGWAAAGIGFIENTALIITGALVGSLVILSYNAVRTDLFVILRFRSHGTVKLNQNKDKDPKKGMDDGALMVCIISNYSPGYGKLLGSTCFERNGRHFEKNVKVSYPIIAGRMPGHMNVLPLKLMSHMMRFLS